MLEEATSSCSSDLRRSVAGTERRTFSVSMLPREKVPVTRYSVQTSAGRAKKGEKKEGKTLIIEAGGDRYKVPDYESDGLLDRIREYMAGGRIMQLQVWSDEEDRFRWEFKIDSSDPIYSDNTQTKKSASIPHGVLFDILEFAEKSHARGGNQMLVRIRKQGQPHSEEDSKKFYLPFTVKELVLDHIKKRGVGLNDLKGWSLIRTAEGLVKTVPKSKNEEPPIVLWDRSEFEIRNHALSLVVRSGVEATSKRALEPDDIEQNGVKRAKT